MISQKPKVIAREMIDTSHLPSSKTLFPDRSGFKVELKTTDTVPTSIEQRMKNNNSGLLKLKKLFEKRPKSSASKKIVEISQLKSKAKGDPKVPQSERIYVWLQVLDTKSKYEKEERHPVYISRGWPLGRALDSIATLLKVQNVNNKTQDEGLKLHLYRQEGDEFVKMSTSERCNVMKDGYTVFLVRGEP
jgi:hypothetical protein